ncbi:TetR/AcrR family transcriptional regulator [Micromonospora polyrhachis]|uniref:AcrR family transcriptional regulator n=1 Tax=Micromonospora polyrhachis TaxID=1282883 RepID=A0A7W7WPA6_9ACTN|nr:TetR/AcrR family transcriptional regulator [Micromonospora polyrhachis]MBB4958068.1 AcrR family transcriptional regulator [Micromonospora polyrhachis]
MKAASIRARVRAEMTDEIKKIARRHLATEGANLSLRAVARDLGIVSSAIYRYFASRDELLTALILDAYNAIGAAVEERERAVARTDLEGRWMAVCHAVRDWALAHPHEYALVYGSPVPGYHAPTDTVAAATRAVTVLAGVLQDGATSGVLRDQADEKLPAGVATDVARLAATIAPDVPPPILARGLAAWVQLFGLINFEVFGQLNNTIEHRDAFFTYQMRAQAALIGL